MTEESLRDRTIRVWADFSKKNGTWSDVSEGAFIQTIDAMIKGGQSGQVKSLADQMELSLKPKRTSVGITTVRRNRSV